MAIMYPEQPKDFEPASLEGLIFERLATLPDDHYVFHSYQIVQIKDKKNYDSEIDFIVFHPSKGVLVIEAKAGQVSYRNGSWRYGNGLAMRHGGPFEQAKRNKYKLIGIISQQDDPFNVLDRCKFMHAVCFPSIRDGTLANVTLPAEAPRELIITYDDLDDMLKTIDRIFALNKSEMSHTPLNPRETSYLVNNVLSPAFDLVPAVNVILDHQSRTFHRMLEEQKILMDFLVHQRAATISGSAGTGKTMLAVEKARRLAEFGSKILFLCFNRELKDHLSDVHGHHSIDYYTIDGYALKMTGQTDAGFQALEDVLTDLYLNDGDLGYDHVIIDEGQDFGQDRIEETRIIEILDEIMRKNNGCFYVFFDRNQLVQGAVIPSYIKDADCRITLYKNCRNTMSIAQTSMKPINQKPILFEGAIRGNQPLLTLLEPDDDPRESLERSLRTYLSKGYRDIVLLSVKAHHKSLLYDMFPDGRYKMGNMEFKWTTCRKFKGLEADVVIMVDVDADTFRKDQLVFYVGASRAKFELSVVAQMTNEEAVSLVNELNPAMKRFSVEKGLAAILGAIPT
jgi:hypothetical protein